MAKEKLRVAAEDTVVLGHQTGEEFDADLEKEGVNREALIASGAVVLVNKTKAKEE